MTTLQVTYTASLPAGTTTVLAPSGLDTPQGRCARVEVAGGAARPVAETATGQRALAITPTPGAENLTLTYHFDDATPAAYPDAVFAPHTTGFPRAANDLVAETVEVAGNRQGLDLATAIACATAQRFTYGHPETRHGEGLDAVPALGCGLAEGSCVDINTYFLAALRSAGVAAGYVTGFFFPDDKGDHCTDGHCWIVTRIDGQVQGWDIAHHLKTGTRQIAPALNPKPGFRVACFHSMGLSFPELGLSELKALIEPMALVGGRPQTFDHPQIRLHHPEIAPVRAPLQQKALT